jgi:iron complex outermembrane receptor protein
LKGLSNQGLIKIIKKMKRTTTFAILLVWAMLAQAQFLIKGTVTDAQGLPLVGAAIQIQGTLAGTLSNTEGVFQLKGIHKGTHDISVSYLGYEKQTRHLNVDKDLSLTFVLKTIAIMADEVVVKSTRAGNQAPGTYTNLNKTQIREQNLGQDLPYILSLSPSVVASSDAGTGIGYTGFRIRGTDANRINVTVNGIPLNDAESHGVFWVNMPDFTSSIDNIQIQRGVGTSTNGAAAFGATINMQTNTLEEEAYAEINSSAGTFNTFKNTVKVGSGLLNGHFAFDARLSKITSDGFIDRAFSDLKSYYLSGGYYAENTLIKVNVFSGAETTYQAWNGVPKVRLESDFEGMQRYEDHGLYSHEETQQMMASNPRTYNLYTYKNETDNYQQDHYQLFFSQKLNENLNFNAALHYTYGRGYYEQYKVDDDLEDYAIPYVIAVNDTLYSSNLIRQKWLDNDFYGAVASLNFKNSKLDASLGGGANRYDGRHFGTIIWAQHMGNLEKDYEWYRNTGTKTDWNSYAKTNVMITEAFSVYVDVQYRHISHEMVGIDDDLRNISQTHNFNFFNPKAGIRISPSANSEVYLYIARASREPNRSAFTDIGPGQTVPKAEHLHDIEAGYSFHNPLVKLGANFYYMAYLDQLVLTGQINDVGSAIMTNVDRSYRRGIELMGKLTLTEFFSWDMNLSWSENKILDFTEYIDNWDTWTQESIHRGKTDIAFSPNVVFNSLLKVSPVKNLTFGLSSQFIGKQYIDNTQSTDRMLDAYLVNNLQIHYTLKPAFADALTLSLLINNLDNYNYETNAWVYSYLLGGERYAMDGYFPQAGTHFLAGITLRF